MSENRTCLFSGFRREVGENCALLDYYAAIGGNSLPTFRKSLSIPSSGFRIFEHVTWDPIGWPETSARNYHQSLCNNPEERSSQWNLSLRSIHI